MPRLSPGALVAYGYDERVATLFAAARDADLGDDPLDAAPARVTRVERSACIAIGADGAERSLSARPLPAVGDWVLAAGGGVRHVLPRWSQLSRIDPGGSGVQTLAANVDVVMVTTPVDRSSAARVERELALAFDSGARPLVLVTKADLDPGDVAGALRARLGAVDVVAVSAVSGLGVEEVRARLRPHATGVLIGPSGAGKSTLANALLDEQVLATGAVRDADQRGRHTTTSRQLVAVPGGGVLIDTPGLRGVGMHGGVEIAAGFADIQELAARCRFSDCGHETEPGCAVRAAIEAGELDADRLRSFRTLQGEAAHERRRSDALAEQADRRLSKARAKGAHAQDKRRPR